MVEVPCYPFDFTWLHNFFFTLLFWFRKDDGLLRRMNTEKVRIVNNTLNICKLKRAECLNDLDITFLQHHYHSDTYL